MTTAAEHVPWHSWATSASHGTPGSVKGAQVATKALALMGAEIILNADLLRRAKEAHAAATGGEPYRAPTPRLQRMHGQGASGKGRRLGRACPVAGQARKKEHAAPVACNDGICHARLELEGPADPRVSLLVDSPRRRRGLLDRAVLHGLHHLFVLRRGRLRCRRLGFDDLASAQNQSHGQDQPCCRQPAVSASSQAYGSHFPSPVRFRRGRPGDADHYSNFRARLFHEVVTLGFLDPIGSWMVASRIHIHGPRPRVVPPSCVIFLPEALRAEPGSFPPP